MGARKGHGVHAVKITGTNNPLKQISKDNYNANHTSDGMFGHTAANITVATNIISPVDTLNIVAGEGAADDVVDFCNFTSDPAIAEGDYVKLLKGSQAITVNHNTASPPANHAPFLLLGGVASKTLDANVEMVFQRRGNNLVECTLTKDITNSLLKSGTFSNITGVGVQSQNLNMNSNKIVNVTDPTSAQDAATKAYTDAVAQGLDIKNSVRVATTANITLSGTQTIDGVSVIAGDRVLVKNQTTGSENGIYVCAAGAWSRATDADTSAKVTSGMYCYVSEGTTQTQMGFVLTTPDPITLGTTSLSFTQFSGAGQIDAGDGLDKTGNQINVDSTVVRTTGAQTVDGKTHTAQKRIENAVSTTTTTIDMTDNEVQTITLSGNTTFSTSNRGTGRVKIVKILCDGTGRTLTFPGPGSWIFVGAAAPTSIAANKTAILTIMCFGSNETDIVAGYAVQG